MKLDSTISLNYISSINRSNSGILTRGNLRQVHRHASLVLLMDLTVSTPSRIIGSQECWPTRAMNQDCCSVLMLPFADQSGRLFLAIYYRIPNGLEIDVTSFCQKSHRCKFCCRLALSALLYMVSVGSDVIATVVDTMPTQPTYSVPKLLPICYTVSSLFVLTAAALLNQQLLRT